MSPERFYKKGHIGQSFGLILANCDLTILVIQA